MFINACMFEHFMEFHCNMADFLSEVICSLSQSIDNLKLNIFNV